MRSSSNKKLLLYASAFCSFLVGLEALVVSPLIPVIAKSEGFSTDSGGLLITAYALLYGLTAPIFGSLSDRWGRKNMMVAGMLIFSLATLSISFGGGLTILLICRAIAGIGGAMVMPSIFALIGDVFSKQPGRALAVVIGAMSASTLLGIPAGAFLTVRSSWHVTFLILGTLSVIAATCLQLIVPRSPKISISQRSFHYLSPFQKVFSQPSALIALLCTFLWWAGFQGLFANMGAFYSNKFSLHINTIGYIFSLSGLSSLLGNIAGGRLSDRIGTKPVIFAACVICGTGILAVPILSFSLGLVTCMHVVWAFATGLGQSSLTTFISAMNPEARGTILAMNSSATYLGMTASTAAAVGLLAYGGYALVGTLCSVMVWLVIPILAYQTKTSKNRPAAVYTES
jgi:predicted MFS family arabinose efflux permease